MKRKSDTQLDSRMKKRLKKSTEGHKRSDKAGSSGGPKFKAKKSGGKFKPGGGGGGDKFKRDGGKRDGKANKRVFNSQGVGPNFNKKKGSAPPVKKRTKNRK